jgi:hypothetical protein
MWHILWIVIKCLFWAVLFGTFYFTLIRVAVIGRGLFRPDMRRVDKYFGLSNSWNSIVGYLGYYILLLMYVVFPVAIALILFI